MEMTNAKNEFTLVSCISSVSKSFSHRHNGNLMERKHLAHLIQPCRDRQESKGFKGVIIEQILAISLQIHPTKWGTEDDRFVKPSSLQKVSLK